MGMVLAILGQILVGLAVCLPTILAASVPWSAPETTRRAGRYAPTTTGRGTFALEAAPSRS